MHPRLVLHTEPYPTCLLCFYSYPLGGRLSSPAATLEDGGLERLSSFPRLTQLG